MRNPRAALLPLVPTRLARHSAHIARTASRRRCSKIGFRSSRSAAVSATETARPAVEISRIEGGLTKGLRVAELAAPRRTRARSASSWRCPSGQSPRPEAALRWPRGPASTKAAPQAAANARARGSVTYGSLAGHNRRGERERPEGQRGEVAGLGRGVRGRIDVGRRDQQRRRHGAGDGAGRPRGRPARSRGYAPPAPPVRPRAASGRVERASQSSRRGCPSRAGRRARGAGSRPPSASASARGPSRPAPERSTRDGALRSFFRAASCSRRIAGSRSRTSPED